MQERINELFRRIQFPYRFRSQFAEWIEAQNWCVFIIFIVILVVLWCSAAVLSVLMYPAVYCGILQFSDGLSSSAGITSNNWILQRIILRPW